MHIRLCTLVLDLILMDYLMEADEVISGNASGHFNLLIFGDFNTK